MPTLAVPLLAADLDQARCPVNGTADVQHLDAGEEHRQHVQLLCAQLHLHVPLWVASELLKMHIESLPL
jgi:hypothetical protein